MKRVGLYFGSFNPIHNGHLIIAQYMLNTELFDSIRFVVSPHNPFKNAADLLPENQRLKMVQLAIIGNPQFEISDIEFSLSKPSYTINTVKHFIENEPEVRFTIIMGGDNVSKLNEWKNIEQLSEMVDFHIYQRGGETAIKPGVKIQMTVHDSPTIDISATYIRNLLKTGKSIQYLVPEKVFEFLHS